MKTLISILRAFLSLGIIIGPLPNNIQNGQIEDAIPVMGNLQWIVNQVNAFAASITYVTSAIASAIALIFAQNNTWSAAQRGSYGGLASSSNAVAINLDDSNNFTLTMTEDTTLQAPSGTNYEGQSGIIEVTQGASTAYTLGFDSSFWKTGAGVDLTISTTLSSKNVYCYAVSSDGTFATVTVQAAVSSTPVPLSFMPPGAILAFAGVVAPSGFLACPTTQTDISRTTYAALFSAIGTTWGSGNHTTTFGMPWFPADYAAIQWNGENVGSNTTGVVLSHTHTVGLADAAHTGQNASGGAAQLVVEPTPEAITTGQSPDGGAANVAAGARVMMCVKI